MAIGASFRVESAKRNSIFLCQIDRDGENSSGIKLRFASLGAIDFSPHARARDTQDVEIV